MGTLNGNMDYRDLLNTFLSRAKHYNNRVAIDTIDMYRRCSLGLVEELFFDREFSRGHMGSTLWDNATIGIPQGVFNKLNSYYITLKTNIGNHNTKIQKELLKLGPTESEKDYVKRVLENKLEESYNNILDKVSTTINNLRVLQSELSKPVDKLNFIGTGYDGYYKSVAGGRVVGLSLTATNITSLTTIYNSKSKDITDFLDGYIINKFTKGYPDGGEYIMFSTYLYHPELVRTRYPDNTNMKGSIKTLLKYRQQDLYNSLTKQDNKGVNGLTFTVLQSFIVKLNEIVRLWAFYDGKHYESKITNGVEKGINDLKPLLREVVLSVLLIC